MKKQWAPYTSSLQQAQRKKKKKNSITFPLIEPRKSYNRQFTIQELILYLQNSSLKSP